MSTPTDDPVILNLTAVGGIAALLVVGIGALFGYQYLVLQGIPATPAFFGLCLVEFGCGLGLVLAFLNLHEPME